MRAETATSAVCHSRVDMGSYVEDWGGWECVDASRATLRLQGEEVDPHA